MWHEFPQAKLTDLELKNFAVQITGKNIPRNYSQDQIRNFLLKVD